MFTRLSVLALLLMVATRTAAADQVELLINGGFDNEPNFGAGVAGDPGYSALTGSQIPGWTIAPGHAVTIHNIVLYPYITAPYSINTDGEGYNGVNADLYQDVATSACKVYTLSFDWQGWWQNSVPHLHVSVTDLTTDLVLVEINRTWDSALHHESVQIAGTGHPVRVRIKELPESGYNDNTFMIDNVSLKTDAASPDLNGDGHVNGADLAIVLGNWGGCGGDLTGDGTTDGADLALVLGAWTG